MKSKDKFRVNYSITQMSLMFHFPTGIQTKSDAHYLASIFDDKFISEMQQRGYDIRTLNFSIEPNKYNIRFTSQREALENTNE